MNGQFLLVGVDVIVVDIVDVSVTTAASYSCVCVLLM